MEREGGGVSMFKVLSPHSGEIGGGGGVRMVKVLPPLSGEKEAGGRGGGILQH